MSLVTLTAACSTAMAITKIMALMTAKTAEMIFSTRDAMTYNKTVQYNGGYNIEHRVCDDLSLGGYHVL